LYRHSYTYSYSVYRAPRDVPLVRRTQTLAVLSFVTMHMMCLAISLALLFNPFTAVPFLLYLGWALFIDDAPKKNGRPIRWFRDLKWFKHFRDYFPISLENSKPLDPSKTYIFGYHPHGIISLGAFCNFATNANDVIGRFPGINISLLTLSVQFNFPIARDILLALNLGDVSKESCLHKLNSGPGSAIMIVVGGAAEVMIQTIAIQTTS
jgi:2-acylglycerol O-acyltransferase 2